MYVNCHTVKFIPIGRSSMHLTLMLHFQLPMVLKVPRITQSALIVCQLPYSLLGFGDILVPGIKS